jgi:hypothetical protein
MSTAAVLNQVIGFLGKEEGTYGVAETLSTTADGMLPFLADGDPAPPEAVEYVFDGNIGRAPGTLAPALRAAPNGRFRTGVFQALFRGRGTAYSATDLPPLEVHRALKAAGFTATYSASPTPQWTYAPTAAGTTFTSLTLRQYAQASIYEQTGVLFNWSFTADGLGVPIHDFNYNGVLALPTDDALPAITYASSGVLPPVASAVVENIGSWTAATIRSVSLQTQRSIDSARPAQNLAGGHAGFTPGGMVPQLTLVVERPARATYNPESIRDAGTVSAVNVQFGTVQYNRWQVAFPQAQLVTATPQNDGPVATVELVFQAHASTPALNDFMSVLLN